MALIVACLVVGALIACTGADNRSEREAPDRRSDALAAFPDFAQCADLYPEWIANRVADLDGGDGTTHVGEDRSWSGVPVAAVTLAGVDVECGTVIVRAVNGERERAIEYVVSASGTSVDDFNAVSALLVALGYAITRDDMPRQTVRESRALDAEAVAEPTSASSAEQDATEEVLWWDRVFEYIPLSDGVESDVPLYAEDSWIRLRFHAPELGSVDAEDLEFFFTPAE